MTKSTKMYRRSLAAASALGVLALASTLGSQPALADDCLLDTDNNGTATAISDTDGGASSGGSTLNSPAA